MTLGRLKRVLILEISPAGHFPYHVRLLLDSDLTKSAEIILASPKEMFVHPAIATCSAPFQRHEVGLAPGVPLEPETANSAALVRNQWGIGTIYRKAFFAVSKSAPIDFVIVPYLDNCLLRLAAPQEAFGGTPW